MKPQRVQLLDRVDGDGNGDGCYMELDSDDIGCVVYWLVADPIKMTPARARQMASKLVAWATEEENNEQT